MIVLLAFVDAIALPKAEVLNVKLALVMPRSSRLPLNGEMDVLPTFGCWMSGGASGDDDAGVHVDEEEEYAAEDEEVEDRPKVPTPSKGDFWNRLRLLATSDDDVSVTCRPKSTNSWTDLGVSLCVGIGAEKARDSIVCICIFCCCCSAGHNWRLADLAVPLEAKWRSCCIARRTTRG